MGKWLSALTLRMIAFVLMSSRFSTKIMSGFSITMLQYVTADESVTSWFFGISAA